MSKRLSKDEFAERGNIKHDGRFSYCKTEYVDMDTPLVVTCNTHGDFSVLPRNHLRGKGGCPKCSDIYGGVRLTTDEFVDRCNKKHNNFYNYGKVEYVNHSSVVTIACPIHGEFNQVAEYHMSGNGCPECAGRVIHHRGQFLSNIPTKHVGTNYDFTKVPETFKPSDKLTIICRLHGEFTTNYRRFVIQEHGCRGCSGHAKKTPLGFSELASIRHENRYSYEKVVYVDCKTNVLVTCRKHGDFLVSPDNHLNGGKGCPKCCHQISSHEDKLYERFPLFSRTNRKAISPYHLDLYSEEHKLAVEVNGRYWHSEDKGKDADYHLNKTKMCLNSGLNLLQFWDDEIDFKFDIVASMINARLGLGKRVFARKCSLLKISYSDGKKFFEENHLQGCGNPSVTYGLFENGDLVAAMSFAKPRFSDKFEWEILRFASELNVSVIGGASRLFKAFLQEYNPNSVVSYADRRYSEGALYLILGFEFSHDSKPNYFYTKGGQNISRYAAQKHKLPKLLGDRFDPEKSEYVNMLDAGFVKVYDCGNKVFTWRPKP